MTFEDLATSKVLHARLINFKVYSWIITDFLQDNSIVFVQREESTLSTKTPTFKKMNSNIPPPKKNKPRWICFEDKEDIKDFIYEKKFQRFCLP